jgi:preprotein translocase subunit SecE
MNARQSRGSEANVDGNVASPAQTVGDRPERGQDVARRKPAEPRAVDRPRKARVSPFKFLQEVRAEGQKVTWPTRKETTVTTIMVFVMVFIASIFFLLADQVMRIAVSFVLGINT